MKSAWQKIQEKRRQTAIEERKRLEAEAKKKSKANKSKDSTPETTAPEK